LNNGTGNNNSSISSAAAASQYAAQYRAMSHYMQTDPSSASIYQYHPLYSGNPGSLTAGTNSTSGTGADESLAPDSHAAALAAAYGAAYATTGNPFASSTGAGGTTGSAGTSGYASYYNNYMAFYPHTAAAAPGYTGYGAGTGTTGPQLPTHPSTTGNQAIYHLNNALPPPSIAEPGINPLDEVVKPQTGKLLAYLYKTKVIYSYVSSMSLFAYNSI
jgi:hypothetical protein